MSSREEWYLDWGTYAFSFANRLVAVRKQRGYSQEELAHRCGLHRNAVSNLERGTSNRKPFVSDPQLSTVYRLAHALEVAPEVLLPDVASATLPKRSAEQLNDRAISRVEATIKKLVPAKPKPAETATEENPRRRSSRSG